MPRSHGSDIDSLIQLLSRLPGLGPRSAKRAVLALLKKRESVMMPLSEALKRVGTTVVHCGQCGNFDTQDLCHICRDPRRDKSVICVVEDVADLWALDRSESYNGLYHVVGGTLSALDGIGPDDLSIGKLVERVNDPALGVKEVILALNATVDGQTTGYYIAEQLSVANIEVTALAHGVPVGGELDYLDDGTLTAALRSRSAYKD